MDMVSQQLFHAMQRENSTSGVVGGPGIILTYGGKELKIFFACPYSGSNYFYVQNDISEVVVTVKWGPGSSGHPVSGTVTIKDKTT